MNRIYLQWNDPTVRKIIERTFPNLDIRDVRAVVSDTVRFLDTQWSEGSRSVYRFLHLTTMETMSIAEAPFLQQSALHEMDHKIPDGVVCVKHHEGRVRYIEIIGPGSNITPMLPAPTELSEDEAIVLAATAGLKSSYGGIKNYRFHRANQKTGITMDRWESAKALLIDRKFLNRNGAITPDGRNALSSTGNDRRYF